MILSRNSSLEHYPGFLKLRAGDYRIIYKVFKTENLIVIHRIGHRREVYR